MCFYPMVRGKTWYHEAKVQGYDSGWGRTLQLNHMCWCPLLFSQNIGNTCLRLDDGCERRPCCQVGVEKVQNVLRWRQEGSGSLINKAPGSLWPQERMVIAVWMGSTALLCLHRLFIDEVSAHPLRPSGSHDYHMEGERARCTERRRDLRRCVCFTAPVVTMMQEKSKALQPCRCPQTAGQIMRTGPFTQKRGVAHSLFWHQHRWQHLSGIILYFALNSSCFWGGRVQPSSLSTVTETTELSNYIVTISNHGGGGVIQS